VYVPAITLIEMLLAGEGMSMDESHPELHLPGFLFDMNIFFQELLSRFLTEHLQEYTIQTQFEIEGMLVYVNNPHKRANPKPRPDYVVRKGGKVVAILDAKYRDLWRNDFPPHMLYQLIMYALSQNTCNSATILYPTTQPEVQEAKIEVRVPRYSAEHAYVMLRPVDLLKLEKLIIDTKMRNNERERKDFARWLAFGDD
jgi:5-methylcytosine-specific restriction enzyme subunit McrC